MHHLILILHLFAATIWVGGHSLLCFRYLPEAIKTKDISPITNFEKRFEILGLPALLILVITGIIMAYDYNVSIGNWLSFESNIERVISFKLIFLLSTLALAIHARIFIIPKLSPQKLPLMAFHIVLITLIGIAMMVLGTFVRYGGI